MDAGAVRVAVLEQERGVLGGERGEQGQEVVVWGQ